MDVKRLYGIVCFYGIILNYLELYILSGIMYNYIHTLAKYPHRLPLL